MAFVAKESSGKGKKGGEGLKKAKKGKCYNCKKVGHYSKDCWVPGEGAVLSSDSRMTDSGLRRQIPKGLGLSLCAVPS
jgi:hypothetical protein